MNLLLLNQDNLTAPDKAVVRGRQLAHLVAVLGATDGNTIRVGLRNGKTGTATIHRISHTEAELTIELLHQPPPPCPVQIILCMPRPKVFRRVLQGITTIGVKDIILLNSYRVEKSYWQSKWLEVEHIEEQLQLGLEQSVDTIMPTVTLEKRFKPFVEDRLPGLLAGKKGIVAHPYGAPINTFEPNTVNPHVLIIGPEGGFIPYELDKLKEAGCEALSLGSRILKVEQAVTYCLAKLSE